MDRFDVAGIGFGPSNISVAVALAELHPELSCRFIDRKLDFSWHEDLMFPEAEMQVPFLKDIVSLRNPQSEFSFLAYLKDRGRLHEFINLRTFYPSRREFDDYYRWVAGRFDASTQWGRNVTSVEADGEYLVVSSVDVSGNDLQRIQTRALVIANGGTPKIPADTVVGSRLFHASESLGRLRAGYPDRTAPYRFNIVGSGQTTADLFTYLRVEYPNASITITSRSFAMRPEDDTHFVNELFFPETTDWFYGANSSVRERVLREHSSAAHSGASYDLIPRIYRARYEARVAGSNNYQFERLVEFIGGSSSGNVARGRYLSLEDGTEREESYDAIILGTGYTYPMPLPLLEGVSGMFDLGPNGCYQIDRDYSIRTQKISAPQIYLQGYAEATHGFSEVLLSLMPIRAAEIAENAARASIEPACTQI